MSIDERMRAALQRDDLWAIPDGAFDEVVAGARHRVARRRAAVGGFLAAAVVVAIVVLAPRGDEVTPEPLPPAPSQGTDPAQRSPIDGTWTTGPVSARQLRSTLRAAGLEQWTSKLRHQLPQGPVTFQLHVGAGRARVHLMPGGELFDDEGVRVSGRRLVLNPIGVAGAHTTYRWHLEGDALRLDFVETTEPAAEEIPGEVYQRAVFTTATFSRTD